MSNSSPLNSLEPCVTLAFTFPSRFRGRRGTAGHHWLWEISEDAVHKFSAKKENTNTEESNVNVRCQLDEPLLTPGSLGVPMECPCRGGEDEDACKCSDDEHCEESKHKPALLRSWRWRELLKCVHEACGGERERVVCTENLIRVAD